MTSNDRSLIHHTGWALFPIAFIARLPFAMMVVGVLTLVVSATGSVGLGGLTSAAVGIGVVIAGPVIGDAVDRFGQRRVLVPLGILNGILLGIFPVVVTAGSADPLILTAAAAIGLSAPQAAAMSRSRLMGIIRARLDAEHRPRTLSRVMSYESAADETAFVIGPFLVGILAAVVAPWAPIAIAAALSLVFVTAFALHPSGQIAATALDPGESEERAPISQVLRGRILVLVAATFGVGLFFGSTLTSLTAFAQTAGDDVEAGLLYGLMGIGSAALALAVVLLPSRFALRRRWLVFAAVLAVSAGGYAASDSLGAVIVMLLLMGLGVGPTLVTLFSIAGHRSPVGRSATTMTLLGSALTLAQALASAVTGAIAEAGEVRLAMLLPTIAAVLVLAFGVVNLAIERRERAGDGAGTPRGVRSAPSLVSR
ncbi:putatie arabinose efflux permease [Microbacterium sp. TS-1]|uniref:MFS transporter n=1 Tax=Microbacterium TaxID=33882 RepID=UPI0003903DC9|nr:MULTISPECIES: MFS transporter [Microbacterium]APF33854.1 MFS transporter [Microbacterium paludicola]GAD33601.1 putatie arabinose efflux permease [Microbacterium sp. TS-1]